MSETRPLPHELVRPCLAMLGGGFAWFAYVDAPITDAAMLLFAGAVIAAFLAVCAAVAAGEAGGEGAPGARWTRASRLLFLLALGLMLAAATVTLNLRGTDSGEDGTDTAAVIPA
jgi:hypothetical protein